ncbi:Leucine-rich repeat protein kinase family protein isoform 1 [Hibiscus syriacus]|uniref:Leucine-rich repeat protein kinase family protein isoform 1 n=2 Tax=Hibiscus syriacus TaxID=106335 RepID=A0A6A3A124_HIBSY|nr:Leucine-rich repeat protein kinase family protein isoform 1 [Hibiscus syriacus]
MIPFYLGMLFRQTGASDDVCSKLGIGEEKVSQIRRAVQKYGNLIGFIERFSLGVRNPTAFLAGSLGISPEFFFAGVCCGGLVTLPIQLGIGFLMRKRPVFALATVATVVGAWTVFPYVMAASTALLLYLRRHFST